MTGLSGHLWVTRKWNLETRTIGGQGARCEGSSNEKKIPNRGEEHMHLERRFRNSLHRQRTRGIQPRGPLIIHSLTLHDTPCRSLSHPWQVALRRTLSPLSFVTSYSNKRQPVHRVGIRAAVPACSSPQLVLSRRRMNLERTLRKGNMY